MSSTKKANVQAGPPAPRVARVDGGKCTLCGVCVRHCPKSAYRTEREGDVLRLRFRPEACDGCPDRKSCVEKCPESAISFAPRSAVPCGECLVAESRMLQCTYCGDYYTSTDRMAAVSRKLGQKRAVERSYCPLCRRTRLVVNLIEVERCPGAKAEYRSGKDMWRRAEERKKKDS